MAEAGVDLSLVARRATSRAADWDFFYRCYERTYYEHGNAPYLTRDFFRRMARDMPENWLLFVAERDGKPIAASLIALGSQPLPDRTVTKRWRTAATGARWSGWTACISRPATTSRCSGASSTAIDRFEGGAQGEHKMARALMPVKTTSAHWLAHPAFADAVERFLEREGQGIGNYLEHLERRSPFRQT